jgi:hypothetical protein
VEELQGEVEGGVDLQEAPLLYDFQGECLHDPLVKLQAQEKLE